MQRFLLIVTLLLFGALSAAALRQHGYRGIFALHLQTFGGAQVLADLVIALGSFGPLVYLLTRRTRVLAA